MRFGWFQSGVKCDSLNWASLMFVVQNVDSWKMIWWWKKNSTTIMLQLLNCGPAVNLVNYLVLMCFGVLKNCRISYAFDFNECPCLMWDPVLRAVSLLMLSFLGVTLRPILRPLLPSLNTVHYISSWISKLFPKVQLENTIQSICYSSKHLCVLLVSNTVVSIQGPRYLFHFILLLVTSACFCIMGSLVSHVGFVSSCSRVHKELSWLGTLPGRPDWFL